VKHGPSRFAVVFLFFVVAACGGSPKHPVTGKPSGVQEGYASWYSDRTTASGERFNKNAFTAAHRTLRFGARVRVTNKRNGRTVEVRINDRGPFGGHGRIIDLSEAAAKKLGMIEDGIVPVRIEVIK
jgi:rare lipoprotein A